MEKTPYEQLKQRMLGWSFSITRSQIKDTLFL